MYSSHWSSPNEHVHHDVAAKGLAASDEVFATCPITQGSLVRFLLRSGQPATTARDVVSAVETADRHEFWTDSVAFADAEIKGATCLTEFEREAGGGASPILSAWPGRLARRGRQDRHGRETAGNEQTAVPRPGHTRAAPTSTPGSLASQALSQPFPRPVEPSIKLKKSRFP